MATAVRKTSRKKETGPQTKNCRDSISWHWGEQSRQVSLILIAPRICTKDQSCSFCSHNCHVSYSYILDNLLCIRFKRLMDIAEEEKMIRQSKSCGVLSLQAQPNNNLRVAGSTVETQNNKDSAALDIPTTISTPRRARRDERMPTLSKGCLSICLAITACAFFSLTGMHNLFLSWKGWGFQEHCEGCIYFTGGQKVCAFEHLAAEEM